MDPKLSDNLELRDANPYPTLPLLEKPQAPYMETPWSMYDQTQNELFIYVFYLIFSVVIDDNKIWLKFWIKVKLFKIYLFLLKNKMIFLSLWAWSTQRLSGWLLLSKN